MITVGVWRNFYGESAKIQKGQNGAGGAAESSLKPQGRHVLMLTRKGISVSGTAEDTSVTKLRIK